MKENDERHLEGICGNRERNWKNRTNHNFGER